MGGAAEVLVGLGPVVPGELRESVGEQAALQDGGQAAGGVVAVFVLAAADGGEQFGQGVGGRVHGRAGRAVTLCGGR
ncbi:hypothetical protein BU198_28430 [Streptomyces sp. CBMA156]|nr:hypothetical protein [Streptomyces sp. CBMA156]MBD0674527.1 hypothetical protein [Streptomyces sp. CBMA156]